MKSIEETKLIQPEENIINKEEIIKNKKYCIIPIQVYNNQFQLIIVSYDQEFIHQSWLVQSSISHPLKQFLNPNNQFQKKYYDMNQFPIKGLKRLQTFSFGFFKGNFQEDYFNKHELQWFKEEDFYLLNPHFVSIPFNYPLTRLSKIIQPFSIVFECSFNLQLKCSTIKFFLMEQMHVREEQSFQFDQTRFYCNFKTPFNRITNQPI